MFGTADERRDLGDAREVRCEETADRAGAGDADTRHVRHRRRLNSRPPVMPGGAKDQHDRHQHADHDLARPRRQIDVPAEERGAVLGDGEIRVEPADRERPDNGAEQARRTPDHEHRERDERQVQVDRLGLHRQQVDVEAAGEPCEQSREREGDQPLDVDRRTDRPRGRVVLARRAQQPPKAAARVDERDHDRDQRAESSLAQTRRLRDRRERVQARPDPLLVAQQVVRDLEHSERGDARGQSGEPHQRHPDEQREHATGDRREHERRDVPDVPVEEE